LLNSRDSIPLYEKLRDILRQQIDQGRYRPGEAIPSERELCREHRISRITVRQAIAGMIHDGLLFRKQGKGTFVARRTVRQGLSRIVTFRRTVLDIGMNPSTRILSHGLLPADLEVANVLKLPDAGQVLRLVLLGRGNDQPLVVYESFYPPAIGRKMAAEARARERRGRPFSSYDLYGRATGYAAARVNQTLEAIAAAERQARMLEVPPGTALLRVTSIFTDRDGMPLELRRALYRGDYYTFNVVRDLS
jgi:GntR family transcriptional regulator